MRNNNTAMCTLYCDTEPTEFSVHCPGWLDTGLYWAPWYSLLPRLPLMFSQIRVSCVWVYECPLSSCVHCFVTSSLYGVSTFVISLFQDDPFTAIDLPIGSHIFEDGILHFCLVKRKRTVILVTHELHFLPFAHAVCIWFCSSVMRAFVTQGLKTRHLSLPRYWARGPNRREGFSSLQFFNSAGVPEFVLIIIIIIITIT